jgi:hypothetical protein
VSHKFFYYPTKKGKYNNSFNKRRKEKKRNERKSIWGVEQAVVKSTVEEDKRKQKQERERDEELKETKKTEGKERSHVLFVNFCPSGLCCTPPNKNATFAKCWHIRPSSLLRCIAAIRCIRFVAYRNVSN